MIPAGVDGAPGVRSAIGVPLQGRPVDEYAGAALWVGISGLIAFYGWTFTQGDRFFLQKTAVMPVLVLYGICQRHRLAFLRDWLPLLAGTILFDAMRGAIFIAGEMWKFPRLAEYPIALERLLLGTPAAPLIFQPWRSGSLDFAAVAVHGSHFAFFLLFGLVLWHVRREHFAHFRYAMLLIMGIGLVCYALVPTVPPWLAARDLHLLPPIDHVVAQIYTRFVPELYGTFDTNPVAAMPSLHSAFPMACALIAWRAYGRTIGTVVMVYALAVMTAVMYLGEHYAVDVIAGGLVAWIAVLVAGRTPPVWPLGRSLSLSAGALALAYYLLWAYH